MNSVHINLMDVFIVGSSFVYLLPAACEVDSLHFIVSHCVSTAAFFLNWMNFN